MATTRSRAIAARSRQTPADDLKRRRMIVHPRIAAEYSAMMVAIATPSIPHPSTGTNNRSSTTFVPFMKTAISITVPMRWVPNSQPMPTYVMRVAGVPQMRMAK